MRFGFLAVLFLASFKRDSLALFIHLFAPSPSKSRTAISDYPVSVLTLDLFAAPCQTSLLSFQAFSTPETRASIYILSKTVVVIGSRDALPSPLVFCTSLEVCIVLFPQARFLHDIRGREVIGADYFAFFPILITSVVCLR